MRVVILIEVDRILDQVSNNSLSACKAGLKRLGKHGLIGAKEITQLGKICDLVLLGQEGRRARGTREIGAIYSSMLLDPGTTPVALAIASLGPAPGHTDHQLHGLYRPPLPQAK